MIIYFDFEKYQIQFVKQQNESYCFAVDFLMEHTEERNFAKIVEDFCTKQKEIVEKLKEEKHFVVLPDCVVGFDNFQVPSNLFGTNKFFKNKFDMVYNEKNDIVVDEHLFLKEKEKSTFVFAMTKKKIVDDIVEGFKKFGIEILGVSYFSKVLSEFLFSKEKQISKQDILVVLHNNGVKLLCLSNGIVVGSQKLNLDAANQNYAKKYSNYIKNSKNGVNLFGGNIENEIRKTKVERENLFLKNAKIKIGTENFKNCFENGDLNIKFEKFCYINSPDKFVGLDDPNVLVFEDCQQEEILSKYKSNAFYSSKRSFWKL